MNIINKPYKVFFSLALLSICIFTIIKLKNSGLYLDISIYDVSIKETYSNIWLYIFIYLIALSLIYFIEQKRNFVFRKWLVICHFIFIILFIILFILFTVFDIRDFQRLLYKIDFPTRTTLILYTLILFFDLLFFIIGLVILLLNVLITKKNKPQI
jgi:hypothetical protein